VGGAKPNFNKGAFRIVEHGIIEKHFPTRRIRILLLRESPSSGVDHFFFDVIRTFGTWPGKIAMPLFPYLVILNPIGYVELLESKPTRTSTAK
jgi:hypothetical protein